MDLSHNEIGDIGALALGQGLAQNDSLNEFDISWNEIRVRGMIGFLNDIKVSFVKEFTYALIFVYC